MKTLSRLSMLAALALAFALPVLAQDAAAQGPCAEPAKDELYRQYYDLKKTDQQKAFDVAKQYLDKYGSCTDNYTGSVKKFADAYTKATARIDFFKAYNEKNTSKLTALGTQLLANDPNDAAAAVLTAAGVYQAYADGNKALAGDAAQWMDRAVSLIESGKEPLNLEGKPSWAPFPSKDEALSYFTYALGSLKAESSPADALKSYIKVAQSSSKTKEDPKLYLNIASIYQKEVAPMYEKYQTFKEETPESKLLLANINRIVDEMIDAYARAVAYTTNPADKAKYMTTLTELYKSRHNNADAGLDTYIAGIKGQPLLITEPITSLPAETPSPTPAAGTGDGAAATPTGAVAAPAAPVPATSAKPAATVPAKPAANPPAQPSPAAPAKKRPVR